MFLYTVSKNKNTSIYLLSVDVQNRFSKATQGLTYMFFYVFPLHRNDEEAHKKMTESPWRRNTRSTKA